MYTKNLYIYFMNEFYEERKDERVEFGTWNTALEQKKNTELHFKMAIY